MHRSALQFSTRNASSSQEVKTKTGPTARSGHRMVLYKRKVVLFGGYFDNGQDIKYLNDLHLFDLDTMQWTAVRMLCSDSGCCALRFPAHSTFVLSRVLSVF